MVSLGWRVSLRLEHPGGGSRPDEDHKTWSPRDDAHRGSLPSRNNRPGERHARQHVSRQISPGRRDGGGPQRATLLERALARMGGEDGKAGRGSEADSAALGLEEAVQIQGKVLLRRLLPLVHQAEDADTNLFFRGREEGGILCGLLGGYAGDNESAERSGETADRNPARLQKGNERIREEDGASAHPLRVHIPESERAQEEGVEVIGLAAERFMEHQGSRRRREGGEEGHG